MLGLTSWAVAGVALGVIIGTPGVATARETPPAGFTWYVLNQLNEFYLDIDDPTNRPPLVTEVPAGVLEPVNVNDDGVTDWLINWPAGAQFCGTGGCTRAIYVSDDGGYRRVFDRQAWDLTIDRIGGETRIEASFHHLNCTPQREDCRLAWAWDPKALALSERPSRDGQHILTAFTARRSTWVRRTESRFCPTTPRRCSTPCFRRERGSVRSPIPATWPSPRGPRSGACRT